MTGSGVMRLPGELWAVGAQVDTLVTEPMPEPMPEPIPEAVAGPAGSAGIGDRIIHLIIRSGEEVERADVLAALSTVGREAIVARGRPEDLGDIATRVLDLATRLAADPASAPRGAAALVLADSWEVTPALQGDDASPFVMRLQWMLDRHVVLRRDRAAFTGYDRQRAAALLELVAALAKVRGEIDEFGWNDTLPSGDDVVIRLARPQDGQAVAAMHERCSERSRFQRYFAPMTTWREENLRRITGEHRGATLVVVDDDQGVVGLGNVFPAGPDAADIAELALIVDDAWQGKGVGRILLRHLVDAATRLGFRDLIAYVQAGNEAMIHVLESAPEGWTRSLATEMGPSALAFKGATNRK